MKTNSRFEISRLQTFVSIAHEKNYPVYVFDSATKMELVMNPQLPIHRKAMTPPKD